MITVQLKKSRSAFPSAFLSLTFVCLSVIVAQGKARAAERNTRAKPVQHFAASPGPSSAIHVAGAPATARNERARLPELAPRISPSAAIDLDPFAPANGVQEANFAIRLDNPNFALSISTQSASQILNSAYGFHVGPGRYLPSGYSLSGNPAALDDPRLIPPQKGFATLFATKNTDNVSDLTHISWELSGQGQLRQYAALNAQQALSGVEIPVQAFNYKGSFAAKLADNGLGVAIAPHAGLVDSGLTHVRSAGAEIRLGRGLVRRVSDPDHARRLYFFAGAGGQAITWDARRDGFRANAVQVEDRIVVGDQQAGFSFERAGMQLSFGWLRRGYAYKSDVIPISRNENFGAVSLTLRR